MIEQENSIVLVRRIPPLDLPNKEIYEGRLLDEPVTVKYNRINNIQSTKENWARLASNLKQYDGVIVFKGYRPENLEGSQDYLISVFESYRGSVLQVTKSGQKWSESQLIKAVLDLTATAVRLSKADKRESLQHLCPGRLLVTEEGCVKFPMVKAMFKKSNKLTPFLPSDAVQGNYEWAPYALGATVLWMANGGPDLPTTGGCDWWGYLPSIRSTHPVLESILRMYLQPAAERYNFEHLQKVLNLGSCFALVRLNEIIAAKEVRVHRAEVQSLLTILQPVKQYLLASEFQAAKVVQCSSCIATRELRPDIVGYRCDCGVVNLV